MLSARLLLGKLPTVLVFPLSVSPARGWGRDMCKQGWDAGHLDTLWKAAEPALLLPAACPTPTLTSGWERRKFLGWGVAKKRNSQVLQEFENHCYQQEKRDSQPLVLSSLLDSSHISNLPFFLPTLNPAWPLIC